MNVSYLSTYSGCLWSQGNGRRVCRKLLSLKEILSADQRREGLISYNGFLHRSLWDAILFQNVPMFQVILEGGNQVLGQDYLLFLLLSQAIMDS